MLKHLIRGSLASAVALAISASSVYAHVVVTPTEVGVATREDFSVGVPNEKDIPTTQVRLVIPEGLQSVTPYVKPGWEITMKKSGEGEDSKVTEITWSEGEIGALLRDNFIFRAMTPSDETSLVWKAYQTYSDGTVVSWDQESEESDHEEENSNNGPASVTKVVNDLDSVEENTPIAKSAFEQYSEWVAYAALFLSVVALALTVRGTNKQQ